MRTRLVKEMLDGRVLAPARLITLSEKAPVVNSPTMVRVYDTEPARHRYGELSFSHRDTPGKPGHTSGWY